MSPSPSSGHASGAASNAGADDSPVGKTRQSLFVRVISLLSEACGWASAAMIVAAVMITCQMIYVRSVLNVSTVWQTEVVIYLVIGATLIGLPYVQKLRGHVNVDLLPIWLGQSARRALALLTMVLTLVVLAVMLFYSVEMWWAAYERGWTSDTVWAAPLWIPYLAMPVGFGLYLLQTLADLVAVIRGTELPFGLPEKR